MHERTCISVSIPVLMRALALCWSAWRRRSARVTPPRVSLTGWRTSWAAPAGWAAAASSRPTWAPKRSAAGGGTLPCERGMNALLILWPVCHVLASFWLFSSLFQSWTHLQPQKPAHAFPAEMAAFSATISLSEQDWILNMHLSTCVIHMYWQSF